MSGEPMPTSTSSLSKIQLPSFVEMLDVSQKNLIKNLWKADDLSISDKIDSIDVFSKEMPKEARVEYRKWRFLMDRSRMPDFYDFQNDHVKKIIAGMFEKYTNLEEFAQIINSIKPALNNPDAFDKWIKNEEVKFEEPLIQKDMKGVLTSQSIGGDSSFNNLHKVLFCFYYRNNNGTYEGRICLFNSSTCSVEEIAKFHNYYLPYQVATTQNKIFAINPSEKSFEIYDLNTRQISRGPNPPEWLNFASVAYFKGKLYYLGGHTNRVDILMDGTWQTGPAFPLPISGAQTITCDEILYVIDGENSQNIYRLSDDKREWIEVGELSEKRALFGIASLNGMIYITGGGSGTNIFKSCLCFDPSVPVGSRISRITDMNYTRKNHSLVAANGKLYAIGGFFDGDFCDSIEEYDPPTNEWREVGKINIK